MVFDVVSDLVDLKRHNSSKRVYREWADELPASFQEALANNDVSLLGDKELSRFQDMVFISLFQDVVRNPHAELRERYYRRLVDLMIAKTLRRLSRLKTASKLAKKVLNFAEVNGFADLALESSDILMSIAASQARNPRQTKKYYDLSTRYCDVRHLEIKAYYYFNDLKYQMLFTNCSSEKLEKLAKSYVDELKPHLWKTNSFLFHLYAVLSTFIYHETRYDLKAAIRIANQGVDYFDERGWKLPETTYQFYINMVQAGLKIGLENLALSWISRLKDTLVPHTARWFSTEEYELKILLKKQDYQEAFDLFCKSYRHPRFKYVRKASRDRWQVYQLYFDYLCDVGEVPERKRLQQRYFKVNYDDIPDYSVDNRGYSVALIIVQLLHFINRREYDQLSIRFTALKRYDSKYLRKNNNFRSSCFIKMLLEIPKRGFNLIAVKRHTQKYLKRMEEYPLRVARQQSDMEIIPYDDLWPIVLNSISKKKPLRQTAILKELRELV